MVCLVVLLLPLASQGTLVVFLVVQNCFRFFFPFVCGWSGSLSSSACFTLHPVVSFLCMLLKIV